MTVAVQLQHHYGTVIVAISAAIATLFLLQSNKNEQHLGKISSAEIEGKRHRNTGIVKWIT